MINLENIQINDHQAIILTVWVYTAETAFTCVVGMGCVENFHKMKFTCLYSNAGQTGKHYKTWCRHNGLNTLYHPWTWLIILNVSRSQLQEHRSLFVIHSKGEKVIIWHLRHDVKPGWNVCRISKKKRGGGLHFEYMYHFQQHSKSLIHLREGILIIQCCCICRSWHS